MYSIHCCTPCGWVMVSTVALATLMKTVLYLCCRSYFYNTESVWITLCMYVCTGKYLVSCYSWLWSVCLWHHRLNITERLTTRFYECMHGEKEWYLENVQALFVSFPAMCTMNALHTCMPSLSASFCHRRRACVVFIGSGWRWGLWIHQGTHTYSTLQCYKMMCSLMQQYIEFLSFHYQAT